MMNARFRLTNPSDVDVTLTLTAKVSEWQKLHNDLADAGEHAESFARRLRDLVAHAGSTLAEERWTTGYATGVSEVPL